METTITLDPKHFKAAVTKARKLGLTPQGYIQSLIDTANTNFDEVLAPVREGFRRSGTTEDELDSAVAEARKTIHARSRREQAK